MHCIVLSSPSGDESWKIHRSVEVLSYHQREKCVRILIWLIAENLLEHDNSFKMLHRGNVVCKSVNAWPLPLHKDEKVCETGQGVLQKLYGKGFEESSGGVLWTKELTPFDSWCDQVTPLRVNIPADLSVEVESMWTDSSIASHECEYRPFTVWNVGSLAARTINLVSFHLEFAGTTYEKLLGQDSSFTIDGPNRLLSRIMKYDLLSLNSKDRQAYAEHASDFLNTETRLKADSYDVVILGTPISDGVKVQDDESRNGIYSAPHQVSDNALRFLTTNQSFTVSLRYVCNNILTHGRDHALRHAL